MNSLSNKTYDILKWLVCIVIPACTTAYVGLDKVFGWGYAEEVAQVSAIVCTLIGSIIGISTAQYNQGKHEPTYGEEVED